MPRKIIQIAVAPNPRNDGRSNAICALADDGSLWMSTGQWLQIDDIPQPENRPLARFEQKSRS